MERSADHLLGLAMPGPFLVVSDEVSAVVASSNVTAEPAVRGLVELVAPLALAVLHLVISSGVSVFHSAGE
jgi:hypothetical protein